MATTATVSILFTDVVGSTNLRTTQGDAEAHRALQRHNDLVRREIESHSGREVKTIGDSFMVAFDSARRAIECAIAVQRALDDQAADGQPLQVRIGIHTGEAILESGDYFGVSVDAAARVMAAASGGEVLISETVRTVLGGSQEFTLKDRGKHELKGLAEPWQLYEVAWRDARPSRSQAQRRTPFVGREEEKTRLLTMLDRTQRGSGGLFMVGGEPGVGKTRLTEEVTAEARRRGFFTLLGHCYEAEGMPPYMPFIETTEYVARVVSPQVLREALGEGASEVMRLSPALRRALPDVPPSPELPPEEGRRHFFDAMVEFIARASRQQPLFMVLDDLHWTDEASLMLLEQLAGRLPEVPIMVVGTYRDIELGVSRPLARTLQRLLRQRLTQDMVLKRLPESAVGNILRAHGPGQPPSRLVSLVYNETEGNPFFVEEVIRFLSEEGKLFDASGDWLGDVEISEVEVPRSVRLVVEQRLERLTPGCRQLLSIASVIGRNFNFQLLEGLAAGDPALEGRDPLDVLEEAVSASLVQDVSRGREARYTFTHELIRQTQLSNLSLPRRQRLHLRVADAIERLYSTNLDTHIAELAGHYRNAGAAADPEKTIAYSERAAQSAQAVYAYEEAAAHWEAVVELLDEVERDLAGHEVLQRKAAILEKLGDLMLVGGLDAAKSADYTERALALYGQLGQTERVAQMHSRLGRDLSIHPQAMDIPRAVAHYKAAEEVLAKGSVRAPLGYVYIGLATTAVWAVDNEGGLAASTRALEIADELGNPSLRASALALQGWHLFHKGKFALGLEQTEQAWRIADETNQMFNLFIAAWLRGSMVQFLGDPLGAIHWLLRAFDDPRLASSPAQRAELAASLYLNYGSSGDVAAFQALMDSGFQGYEAASAIVTSPRESIAAVEGETERVARTGNRFQHVALTHWQAWNFSVLGEFEEASAKAEESVLPPSGVPLKIVHRCYAGIFATQLGNIGRAREHLSRCLEAIANGEDWRGLVGFVRWLEGVVTAAGGDIEEAAKPFSAAVETLERFNNRLDEADALYYWAKALIAAGRATDAADKIDQAVAIYEGHGFSQFFVDRARSLLVE
jgi:class 3 adenylate cyclase/tetratricopeptide (TPR) repeat protein